MNHTGRPPKEALGEIVRQLTAADIAGLSQPRGVKPTRLQRLTDMHHAIARMVAQGQANYAICMATGYSQSRISILKGDPAFQELVAHYGAEVNDVAFDSYEQVQAKLRAMSMDGLDILHEMMLNGEMQERGIQENVKMSLDRTGHGPQSKTASVNLNLDYATQIAEGRQRADALTAIIPEARAGRPDLTIVGPPGPPAIEQVDFRRTDGERDSPRTGTSGREPE